MVRGSTARRNLSSKLDEEAKRAASEEGEETAGLMLEPVVKQPQLARAREVRDQLKKELKGACRIVIVWICIALGAC